MTVKQLLSSQKTTFSFEFFPPKTEKGWELLFQTVSDIIPLKPSWVSVTYGAGGSTREKTNDIVKRIKNETNLSVVSHLTCTGSTKEEIKNILDEHQKNGVNNILALRGDPPTGTPIWQEPKDGFKYSSDLVAFIKENFPEMSVGVAAFPEGHPATPNRLHEIEYLKQKVDAGADYIITQLFFDNHIFYDFCERCAFFGINVPIIAGIMPITSKKGMYRIAELALGANIPARLLKSINRAVDDEYVAKAGVHWATEQVRDLLDNDVKGVHFYTLNKSNATIEIYKSLGVKSSSDLLK